MIKIGKYYEQNEIPETILDGKYTLHEFNPLTWTFSYDLSAYVRAKYKTREKFIEMLNNAETHWGYELRKKYP